MEHGDVIEIRVDYVLKRNWYSDEVGNTLKALRELTGIEYDKMTVDLISNLKTNIFDAVTENVKERLLSFIRDILDIPDIEKKLETNIFAFKIF